MHHTLPFEYIQLSIPGKDVNSARVRADQPAQSNDGRLWRHCLGPFEGGCPCDAGACEVLCLSQSVGRLPYRETESPGARVGEAIRYSAGRSKQAVVSVPPAVPRQDIRAVPCKLTIKMFPLSRPLP